MGVAEAADALVDWVDGQALDDLIVVMNDTGGAIGTALAIRRPERLR